MSYFSEAKTELLRAGIREGELAIYTGTMSPLQTPSRSVNTDKQSAYVYFWQDGEPLDMGLSAQFQDDGAGLSVLEVQAGEEKYVFLRDEPSGYIRQVSGPAKPIVAANLGAVPLRVDTFLGKFAVRAGTMLRMDLSAPQRENRKVLITFLDANGTKLIYAELWEGGAWRRLDVCGQLAPDHDGFWTKRRAVVRDGPAIVQQVEIIKVIGGDEFLMMDPPEPDPDYEIYLAHASKELHIVKDTLRFLRTDAKDGRIVWRTRNIGWFCGKEGGDSSADADLPKLALEGHMSNKVYDLQKLRETPTQRAVARCAQDLSDWRAALAAEGETRQTHNVGPCALPEEPTKPNGPDAAGGGAETSCRAYPDLEALSQPAAGECGKPVPEPPEDFPE